jgi:uncharacterized protein (DUF2141 family)
MDAKAVRCGLIPKLLLFLALITPVLIPATSALRQSDPAPPGGCSLVVHVDGFRNHKGVIGCVVFRALAGWPEDDNQAYLRAAMPIAQEPETFQFAHVPPGRYAIAVLHDENENRKLDRNIFRVPKEGFGFANNPTVTFSAPSWKDASVQVGCPVTELSIHLIYK